MKNSKTIRFHTNDSLRFLPPPPPPSLSTHNCCTTGMTRTNTSVSTAQLLIFLLCLLPASVAREIFLYQPLHANKAQMKAYRKLYTLRPSFFSQKAQGCRVLSHSPRATVSLNLWLFFLSWHILCPGNTAVG